MILEDVLVVTVCCIPPVLIIMLAEKSLWDKRFTFGRFCKNVVLCMISCAVFIVVAKFNWPKWIMYTVGIVIVIALAEVVDVVWKGKDNNESD